MANGFDNLINEPQEETKKNEPSKMEHCCSLLLARLYLANDISDKEVHEILGKETIYNQNEYLQTVLG